MNNFMENSNLPQSEKWRRGPDIPGPSQWANCKFPSNKNENCYKEEGCADCHREEDDDPGAGVVVLAVRVQQADGVQEWRVEGPHVREVGRLKSLPNISESRLKSNLLIEILP